MSIIKPPSALDHSQQAKVSIITDEDSVIRHQKKEESMRTLFISVAFENTPYETTSSNGVPCQTLGDTRQQTPADTDARQHRRGRRV